MTLPAASPDEGEDEPGEPVPEDDGWEEEDGVEDDEDGSEELSELLSDAEDDDCEEDELSLLVLLGSPSDEAGADAAEDCERDADVREL